MMPARLEPNPALQRRLVTAGALAGLVGALLVGVAAATVDVDGTLSDDEAWRVVVSLFVCAIPIGALLGRASVCASTRATVGLSVAACLLTSCPTAIVMVLVGRALGRTPMAWSSAMYLALAGDAYLFPPLVGYGVAVGLTLDRIRRRTPATNADAIARVVRVFD